MLEQFRDTPMGRECQLLSPRRLGELHSGLHTDTFSGALLSPHEIRVESRDAIAQLAAYLEEGCGVAFRRDTVVHSAAPPRLETSRGPIMAEAIVVCPGDDFRTLHPDRIAAYGLTRCKLHMMRLRPDRFDATLPPIMSDLGLIRYLGYAEQPAATALRGSARGRAGRACPQRGASHRGVRSADGSLIVGDSHHYAATPDPFGPASVDALILDEYAQVFDGPPPVTSEHWIGTYASAPDRLMLVDRPSEALRIVLITSGTGASTSFAIGEEVVAELYG